MFTENSGSLKSSIAANFLSVFVILAGLRFAGYTYLTVPYIEHVMNILMIRMTKTVTKLLKSF